MLSPDDLPGRMSQTHDLHDLQQRVQRETSPCGTSSLVKSFITSGASRVRVLPLRYLRHGFIALSIPIALIAGAVIPVAKPTVAVTPVAASYAVQGGLSAFVGDGAIAGDTATDEFVFSNATATLGAPVNTLYAPVSADVANLRSGPGTDYARVGKLRQGQTVRLLGRSDDWYKVQAKDGTTGWLHSELVDVADSVANNLVTIKSTSQASSPAPARLGTTTDENVNLRKGPGTDNEVITKLPAGIALQVLSQQNGWFKVSTPKGTVGWITNDFFKVGAASTAKARSNGPVTATLSESSVNLRKGPNTRFASYGKMAQGTSVEVLARNGDWLKVRSPRGTIGWIAQDLIDIGAEDIKLVPITTDVPTLPKPVPAVPVPVVPAAPAPAAPVPAAPSGGAAGATAASMAVRFVGSRYVYGGASPQGFDCSGLTLYIYKQLGINLPHKASLQYNTPGQRIGSISDLAPGDLVFFVRTTPAKGITHVGIYTGNGMMVTANTPQLGVQFISIYGQYWNSRFVGGIRPAR